MPSNIDSVALYKIFHPRILQRVQDNEIRFGDDELKFTLSELFETSNRESQDIIDLLSKSELKEVLQKKGIEKKEITKQQKMRLNFPN